MSSLPGGEDVSFHLAHEEVGQGRGDGSAHGHAFELLEMSVSEAESVPFQDEGEELLEHVLSGVLSGRWWVGWNGLLECQVDAQSLRYGGVETVDVDSCQGELPSLGQGQLFYHDDHLGGVGDQRRDRVQVRGQDGVGQFGDALGGSRAARHYGSELVRGLVHLL